MRPYNPRQVQVHFLPQFLLANTLLVSPPNIIPFLAHLHEARSPGPLLRASFLVTYYACLPAGEAVISNADSHTLHTNLRN